MRFTACIALSASLTVAAGHADTQQAQPSSASVLQLPPGLQAALRLIPAESQAAIIIPHLKHASDHLTRLLEGMDRAGILIGSRPIDHFKSITGFATAVDDNGATALVVSEHGTAWLVPVTNTEEFIAANFTPHPDQAGALRSADGRTVYAGGLQTHVLLSDNVSVARDFMPVMTQGQSLAGLVGERAPFGATDADVIVIARAPMIRTLRERVLKIAGNEGIDFPAMAALTEKVTEQIDAIVWCLQCDPLALVVHASAFFKDGSVVGVAAPPQPPDVAGLSRLPNQPATLALSINIAALGGAAAMRDITGEAGLDDGLLPSCLSLCRSLQVYLAPSPAGAVGGALNGAYVAMAGDDPQKIRDAIKRDLTADGESNPPARQSRWTDDQALPDGTKAALYESRSINPTDERAMIETMLFGSAGARGYVAAAGDSIIVTFAHRPALLNEAIKSAQEAAPAGFASSAAVRIMRQWMPAQRDIEGYIGTGQASAILQQFASAMPLPVDALPRFDESLPPVGFALDVSPRRIDGGLIVPAGVLGPMLDEFIRRRQAPPEPGGPG
ncbi:MAG TPA: hypothetical protein VMS30_08510 [Phycisphaerales bacterium]|nr:hypothetical protein [Phycisphaerales bacterium]